MSEGQIYFWVESNLGIILQHSLESGENKRICDSKEEAIDLLRQYSSHYDSDPSNFILHGGVVEPLGKGNEFLDD